MEVGLGPGDIVLDGDPVDPSAAKFGRRRRILSVGGKSAAKKFGQADDGVSVPPPK